MFKYFSTRRLTLCYLEPNKESLMHLTTKTLTTLVFSVLPHTLFTCMFTSPFLAAVLSWIHGGRQLLTGVPQ